MEEWRSTLTPKEIDAISSLRTNIQDILKPKHDDVYLYRFLKARKFDVAKAEKMLRESEKWRADYGTDTLLDTWEPPEVLLKHWPGGVFGFDKHGHPILWQLSKDFKTKEMMKSVKKSDLVKYHIWRQEKCVRACRESSKLRGKVIYKQMHISDLDGFSIGQIFSADMNEVVKRVFAIMEANYPENLYTSYVINAPAIFPAMFNILRPFLSQETKQKVRILGSNWRDELFRDVDPSEIPVFWGGTARAPDDRCSDHVYYKVEVMEPDEEILSAQEKANQSRPELETDVDKLSDVIESTYL